MALMRPPLRPVRPQNSLRTSGLLVTPSLLCVAEHRHEPLARTGDFRHPVDGLIAAKDQQRARSERKLHHSVPLAIEHTFYNLFLVGESPGSCGTYSNAPPFFRRLQHERHGELGLIEVPAVLAAVLKDVDRAGAHNVRKAV